MPITADSVHSTTAGLRSVYHISVTDSTDSPENDRPATDEIGSGTNSNNQANIVITIPDWLTRDWLRSFVHAALSCAIGLVAIYILGVFFFIGTALPTAFGTWEWQVLFQPWEIWATYNSLAINTGMIYTGIVVVSASVWTAGRLTRQPLRNDPSTTSDTGEPAGWMAPISEACPFAVVYAFVTLGIAIVGQTVSTTAVVYNPAGVFFTALLLGFVAAFVLSYWRHGLKLSALFKGRIQINAPDAVSDTLAAGRKGVKLGLILAVGSLAAWMLLTSLIELTTLSTPGLRTSGSASASIALLQASSVLWSWVDVGVGNLILASRLFLGGASFGIESLGPPVWAYVGLIFLPAAFGFGGYRAAASMKASTQADGAKAGAAIAIFVLPVTFIWAIWNTEVGSTVIATALFLPFVWALLFGAAGGIGYVLRSTGGKIVISAGRAPNPAEAPTPPTPPQAPDSTTAPEPPPPPPPPNAPPIPPGYSAPSEAPPQYPPPTEPPTDTTPPEQ